MARPKGATDYTPKQIDSALLALAFTGSVKEARAQCVLMGFSPSEHTLRRWRKTDFAARYVELYNANREKIEEILIAGYTEVVQICLDTVKEGVALTHKQIVEGTVRDAATAAYRMALIGAIYQDKAFDLQGRPKNISGPHPGSEALQSLAKRFRMERIETVEEPKELGDGS